MNNEKERKKRESPTPLNSQPNKKCSPPESPNQRKISEYFSKTSSSANLLQFSGMGVDAADYVASTPKTSIPDIDSGTVSESAIVLQNEQLFDETLSQFSIRSVENSSQIKSEISEILLDFDSLPFHMAGPPRYTLLMVDPKRISSTTPNLEDWKKNGEDFAYIGPSFLKAGLITDGDINFDINVNNEKSRWIKIHKDQTKEQRNYYIVQLLKKEQRLRTLNF
ncbi:hypothetical protein, partial [Candidatus Paracaedibacter symbiosus]|uniref:hypothetical protein n=1 Tax=Candidatus Paracaedibacter symbiosus TaxID=244582 RepID=UPI0012EBFF9F